MPESLENQFISDLYTSLLHLSGADLGPTGPINNIFDGAGNSTGLALSGERVIVNNYIYPRGFETREPLEWLDCFFPVGSLQLTFDDNNPTDRIAGTTWSQVAKGRFLVGTGTFTDKNGTTREFCPGGEEEEAGGLRGGSGDIRGEYKVTLTQDQLPAHSHDVDIGAVDIQVPNEAGSGAASQASDVATQDSTQSFADQLRARHSLLGFLRVAPFVSPTLDVKGISEAEWSENFQDMPWVYALDFNFDRGSARNYSPSTRALYTAGWAARYQFKEMFGIWNGETRFVADIQTPTGEVRFATNEDFANKVAISPYQFAKSLGAVDIGEVGAGEFITSNSEVPTITGPTNVLNRQEGANNTRVSAAVGLDTAHNNILPSYGVYVWKRIA
tara:strand:- start:18000 stop:19160 length:1161 start_codon:yes stop_codon:yes gene_type:complete